MAYVKDMVDTDRERLGIIGSEATKRWVWKPIYVISWKTPDTVSLAKWKSGRTTTVTKFQSFRGKWRLWRNGKVPLILLVEDL